MIPQASNQLQHAFVKQTIAIKTSSLHVATSSLLVAASSLLVASSRQARSISFISCSSSFFSFCTSNSLSDRIVSAVGRSASCLPCRIVNVDVSNFLADIRHNWLGATHRQQMLYVQVAVEDPFTEGVVCAGSC